MPTIVHARLDPTNDRIVRCGRQITTRSGEAKYVCDGELALVVAAWNVRALAVSPGWEQQPCDDPMAEKPQVFRLTRNAQWRYRNGMRPAFRRAYASNAARSRGETPGQEPETDLLLPIQMECPDADCGRMNLLDGERLRITFDLQLPDFWREFRSPLGRWAIHFGRKHQESDPVFRALGERRKDQERRRIADVGWRMVDDPTEQVVAALYYPASMDDDFDLTGKADSFRAGQDQSLRKSWQRWVGLDAKRARGANEEPPP
jgi:hypothetical protein